MKYINFNNTVTFEVDAVKINHELIMIFNENRSYYDKYRNEKTFKDNIYFELYSLNDINQIMNN